MSFILDALKKSESDRQRQSGPALYEVKVAQPRRGLPPWAIAIAALLIVNLGIVGWMLLRHPGDKAGAEADSGVRPAASAPAPAVSAPAAAAPAGTAPQPSAPPAAAAAAPPGPSVTSAPAVAGVPTNPPPLTVASAAAGTAGAAPAATGSDEPNPEDYTPAAEPAPGSLGTRVRRGTASGVPLYQEAAAGPGTQIPALRLDLHVFALRPQDRFVMINMHKLREGETLPEGVHVDSITPEGAVLSYHGSRFLLPRE